jgi:hypothetical protein
MAMTTSTERGACVVCGGTFARTANGKIGARASAEQPRRCIG